jgi:Family of unknown function (DUF6493)
VADDVLHQIERRVAHRDYDGLLEVLVALDEPERRRVSTAVRKKFADRWDDLARAAVFATGGAAAGARGFWYPTDPASKERLIRARSREWRQDWAERAMADDDAPRWDWAIVHRMVKDGVIDRPEAPGYLTAAVWGIRSLDPRYDARNRTITPLAELLRREPAWLEVDLWRLLALEDAGLTSRDGDWGGHQSWRDALCELAAEGTVPRDRLLDATLEALRRDFSPHNTRWFTKMHDALEPTPEEHAARLDDLLALLAAEDPANVGFSLRALGRLERAKRLPADRLLDAVAPALLVPVKGHATRAVKLVGRVLKREPGLVPAALPLLVDGLAHEAREVQEAALDAIEAHRDALGDAEVERLRELAADVDPALRARAESLAGASSEPTVTVTAVAVPGRRPPAAPPRLEPLLPVRDVDDLLDRLAVALEHDDADEIELLLDGISRLRDQPVDPGRAEAVVERAIAVHMPWRGVVAFLDAKSALIAVLLRWLGGREHRRVGLRGTGDDPREAIAVRVRELLGELPGGRPRALLATPTHAGGWIDPDEAARRVAALGGARPPVMDLAQLVLRLGPGRREPPDLDGEAGAILARALGGNRRRKLLTRLGAAWEAAEHARDPATFALPQWRLDSQGPVYSRRSDREARPASPAALVVAEDVWWAWAESGIDRWLATVWPGNRDYAFQMVARRLWIDDGTRIYGIGDVLELLLDPGEPVGDWAVLAIALALGASDAADRTLAADVAIATLATLRLDGDALGGALAHLLREQSRVVPARWEGSVGDVAAAGPLQAHHVQRAIEVVLAAALPDDRRRLHGVVQVLRRLALEGDAAVAEPGARAWLERLPPRSKGGRAAREALAVTGTGAARSRAAAEEAGS